MWQEGEGEWAYSCTTLHKASKTLNVCSLRPIAPRFTSGSILHPRVLSSEDKRLVLPALRVRIHYFHTVSTARVSIAVLGKILIISLNWRQPRNVCTRQLFVTEFWWNTHTHTHTHIYIYIYILFVIFTRTTCEPTDKGCDRLFQKGLDTPELNYALGAQYVRCRTCAALWRSNCGEQKRRL